MLVLVHGFTQLGASWGPVVERLTQPAVTPDVPTDLDLWGGAAALAESCGSGTWCGYSMGGRLALHVALARPDVVERLVLVGATAGIADPVARAERVAADEALAASAERDGADAFLERWLSLPLFAGLTDAGPRNRDAAALASSLRLMGTGTQAPLDERLPSITCPVLLVAGEHDAKFRAEAERLAVGLPDARIEIVAGAGHPCHLERPAEFAALLERFSP